MPMIYRRRMQILDLNQLKTFFHETFLGVSTRHESDTDKKVRENLIGINYMADHLAFGRPGPEKTKTAAMLIVEFAICTHGLSDKEKVCETKKFLGLLDEAGFKAYNKDNFFTEIAPPYIKGADNIAAYRQVGFAIGQLKASARLEAMLGYELRRISEGVNPSSGPAANHS